MSTTTAPAELRRDFGGAIIEPDDPAYAEASRTVLASGSPDLVLRATSEADVRAAVRFAAGARLPLSVRGGGHSFAGFGTSDGGVVLDIRALDSVELVDQDRGLVRVAGGATWGQVTDALAPYGLAISSGDTRTVGVGGLTLSGGIGWKVRKHGLALDSLVAAEVVLASGEPVRASADERPELFWALRGGGGNLGVVTSFEFAAQPTTDVFFGALSFPAAEAGTVLSGLADYLRTGPEEVTANVVMANPFAGGPDAPVEILVSYDGDDPDQAARALDPIRALGTVLSDSVRLTPYADVLEEGLVPPPGIEFWTRSAFVERESVAEVLRILVEVGAAEGSPIINLRSVGGAFSRVPGDATAFAHRRAELMIATTLVGPGPVVSAAKPGLAAVWTDLAPHVTGAYANFLSAADDADVAAVYPADTYRRLAAVKREYDPGNVFSHNHNVPPAT
ncbi:MAG: FAD-binding oxidoreductase [Nocardioides sp.]